MIVNKEESYFSWHSAHQGLEARYRGKVICKAQAYQIEKSGEAHMIDWHEKPGWDKGELVDQAMYYVYLKSVLFL